MIITISGKPGSGKSTVAKIIAAKLGLNKYSIGDLRGKMALDRGITIDELNEVGEKEDFTDKKADEYQEKLGKDEDNFVIDGRLSYYFIPHSIKIFLDVDDYVGAQRIFSIKREDEEQEDSIEELKNRLSKRVESDHKRYQKYYSIDFEDKVNFDIIIDTTDISTEKTADKILSFIEQKGYK
jgi:predicted cytidylate kinase